MIEIYITYHLQTLRFSGRFRRFEMKNVLTRPTMVADTIYIYIYIYILVDIFEIKVGCQCFSWYLLFLFSILFCHFYVLIYIPYRLKLGRYSVFVGDNFRHQDKISSLLSNKILTERVFQYFYGISLLCSFCLVMKNYSYALFARARVWIGMQLRFLSLIFFLKN